MENLFDTSFLFASLLWGSVGMGYFIYGKKQSAMMPMIGGVVICAVSYVVSSWLLMTPPQHWNHRSDSLAHQARLLRVTFQLTPLFA